MDIAALLLAVAALALAFALGVALLLRRRRASDLRLAQRLSDLDKRLTALAQGLGDTVDRAARHVAEPTEFTPTRYYYPEAAPESADRSSVVVPLEAEGRQLGSLTVFGLEEEPPVAGSEPEALHAISRRGAQAIETTRAPAEPEPLPVAENGLALGDRKTFHETLAVLVARAKREERRLAVFVVDVDELELVNERIGPIASDALLAEIGGVLGETIGSADLAFRTGGDEYAVILPDAGRIEGEALYARLQGSLGRSGSPAAAVGLSAGIAERQADDDGVSLFDRALRELQKAKQAGKS